MMSLALNNWAQAVKGRWLLRVVKYIVKQHLRNQKKGHYRQVAYVERWSLMEITLYYYHIQSYYHTVRLGFSKILRKLVVKYVPTILRVYLIKKKKKKDQQRTYQIMLMRCLCFFCCCCFYFLYKSRCRYSFELHRQTDAIQWLLTTYAFIIKKKTKSILAVIWRLLNCWFLFVLRFYGPVNPMGSCQARSIYLATRLLGRLSPLSG